jgi:hypothetical protein
MVGRFLSATLRRSPDPCIVTESAKMFYQHSSRAAGTSDCSGGVSLFKGWHLAAFIAACAGLLAPLATPSATAQVTIQPAVVLDLAVAPGLDPILGRKAADALAVELQRSGDFEIVPRQTVEQAVTTQPGLAPPYNEATQGRLAQAVSARQVFSGRVLTAEVTNKRTARVTLEVRQLETITTDYINGTTVSESTGQLGDASAEVLIDQSLNKAAATAVLRLKRNLPPAGKVMNTTVEDAELNVGARVGAAVGQRYSVLRDVYNRSKDRVERIKIGEVQITRVEMDQSVARIVGNNPAGVRTGDYVRQIFVQAAYPTTPSGGASAPASVNNTGASPRGKKSRAGSALGGIAALVLLAALFGMGGGGGGANNAPRGVVARAVSTLNRPSINVTYTDGVPRLTVPRECIVGYFIYRGISADATLSPGDPIDFQQGNTTQYSDNAQTFQRREVQIDEPDTDSETDPCPPAPIGLNRTTNTNIAPVNDVTFEPDNIDADFIRTPVVPGLQYFYRVRRVTVERRQTTDDQGDIEVQYNLVLSDASAAGGGATALLRPTVLRVGGEFATNFFVTIAGFTTTPTTPPVAGTTPATQQINAYQDDGIRFIIQLSNDPNFGSNVFEVEQPNRAPEINGDLTFNLGQVIASQIDTTEAVYARVGVYNPTDQVPVKVFSDRTQVTFGAAATLRSLAVNKASAKSGAVSGGVTIPTGPKQAVGVVGLPSAPPNAAPSRKVLRGRVRDEATK